MSDLDKWHAMPQAVKSAAIGLFKSVDIDIEAVFTNNGAEPGYDGAEWIRLGQAARMACVSPYTVRQWCSRQLVQWRKLNKARCGRIVINRGTLMDFIDGMRSEGGAA